MLAFSGPWSCQVHDSYKESQEKALKLANEMRAAGTDIIYCSGLVPERFQGLAKQHFPCCGHVGYLPVSLGLGAPMFTSNSP